MEQTLKIKKALISVWDKDQLLPFAEQLKKHGIEIYSTGGTYEVLKKYGFKVQTVESLTSYPSILGGRVKTLHPKVFGGILARREQSTDMEEIHKYMIPLFDLVVVDLYPFEKTVSLGASEPEIIEKIDIGGISLIRAAAKNFNDVAVISQISQYDVLVKWLNEQEGTISLDQRKELAMMAFETSSHYDSEIFKYFQAEKDVALKLSIKGGHSLRYGENPHQKGVFYGAIDELFEQLNGKEVSYNNLLDIEAGLSLIREFEQPALAILKHNNACGVALRDHQLKAWELALEADPTSAFGGVIVANRPITEETAQEINKIFFEVIIAPGYEKNSLDILKQKKNRIVLYLKSDSYSKVQYRSLLNGVLVQTRDLIQESFDTFRIVSGKLGGNQQQFDLMFANQIVKHTRSNAIVLAKNGQMLASGTGQTSRVDALKQAIAKAASFGLDVKGSVMASDAFFPFPDCVEIAHQAGINAIIQPGGSVNDKASIEYCLNHDLCMVLTGIRHFKH